MASTDLTAGDNTARPTLYTAAALFSLLFSLYILSYNGVFTSDDEQHLASGAQTFALTGQLSALPVYGNPRLQGNFYEVDPALPILGSLIYRWVSPTALGSIQALYLLNPFVTALTAVLIFLIGRQWGYPSPVAVSAALLFGIGSMAWPYAGTFFRDPLAALFVMAAWYCYEAGLNHSQPLGPRIIYWAAFIVFLALGVLAKNIVIPLIPVLAVVALLRHWQSRVWWGGVALFLLICAVVLLRPQTPFLFRSSGAYFVWLQKWLTVIPHTGFWPAVWGALVSPGKGLLVYAPFTLLVPLAWFVAGRTAWPRLLAPTLWLITIVCAQSFFYDYRWTNPQWGARYLLPALPGLAIAALPAVHWLWARSRLLAQAVLAGLLGLGILTQLPGVLIAPPTYSAILQAVDRNAFYNLGIWNPYYSAVAGHWRLILSGSPWLVAWARNFLVNPFGVIALVIGVAGALVTGIVFLRSVVGPARRPVFLALALTLLAPVSVLFIYRQDPAYFGDRPELMEAVQYLNTNAGADDLIAVRGYLDPFWFCYFNFGRPLHPWVGLPLFNAPANDAPPGDPFYLPPLNAREADQALFTAAPQTFTRLWFIDSGTTPHGTEGFDVEAWLRRQYKLGMPLTPSQPSQILMFDLRSN